MLARLTLVRGPTFSAVARKYCRKPRTKLGDLHFFSRKSERLSGAWTVSANPMGDRLPEKRFEQHPYPNPSIVHRAEGIPSISSPLMQRTLLGRMQHQYVTRMQISVSDFMLLAVGSAEANMLANQWQNCKCGNQFSWPCSRSTSPTVKPQTIQCSKIATQSGLDAGGYRPARLKAPILDRLASMNTLF